MSEPSWLVIARKYIGLREIKGKAHNRTIVGWWEKLKAPFRDDETAWCGAFVGGVLAEDGKAIVSGPAGARNWLKLPNKIDKPALGCVVVFWRGSRNGWSGHVGFVVGKDTRGNLMVLGGNQGDAVNIKPFSPARVLGYRWPSLAPLPERYNLPVYRASGSVSTNEA
jgi:uncharacterized protein (TIGR02594 family)